MKKYLQILVFVLTTSVSSSILAQEKTVGSVFSPLSKYQLYIDSVNIDRAKSTVESRPSKSSTNFQYQLPLNLGKQAEILIEQPELAYQYNMPVMKSHNNSKILLDIIDPEFPYMYTMPIKPEGVGK